VLAFDGANVGATRDGAASLTSAAVARVSLDCFSYLQRSSLIVAIACIVRAHNLSRGLAGARVAGILR